MPDHTPLPFDPIARAGEIWEDTWGPSERMRLATAVMRVQQILLAKYDDVLKPHGLTFSRFEALVLLKFSKRGSLPMKIVGDRLQVHPTSVTNIVGRLAAAGLVSREENPRDGRGVLAVITPAGREIVEAAAADLMKIDFALADLDLVDVANASEILRRLRASVGDFTAEETPRE